MQPRERLLQQAAAGRGAAAGRAGRQRRHALCQRRPLKWPLGLKVLQQRHRLAAVAAAAVRPPGAARGRDERPRHNVVHAARRGAGCVAGGVAGERGQQQLHGRQAGHEVGAAGAARAALRGHLAPVAAGRLVVRPYVALRGRRGASGPCTRAGLRTMPVMLAASRGRKEGVAYNNPLFLTRKTHAAG